MKQNKFYFALKIISELLKITILSLLFVVLVQVLIKVNIIDYMIRFVKTKTEQVVSQADNGNRNNGVIEILNGTQNSFLANRRIGITHDKNKFVTREGISENKVCLVPDYGVFRYSAKFRM